MTSGLRSLFLLLAGFSSPAAFASGAFQAFAAPMSLGAPTDAYLGAYAGTGLGLQGDFYWNNTNWGLTGGVLSQGSGQLEWIRAKYYLNGHPQIASSSSSDQVQIEPRSRGYFVELGVAPYQITETTATALSTTSGVGAVGAVGMEQPLFFGLFLGLRADFLTSVGGTSPFSVLLFEASVGLPISF